MTISESLSGGISASFDKLPFSGRSTNDLMKPSYLSDEYALQGKNDFMLSHDLGGITRYGISHAQVTNSDKRRKVESMFGSMQSGVYGAVAHSIEDNNATGDHSETDSIIRYMEYLHSADPTREIVGLYHK